jgi:hypothetical protein
MFLSRGEKKSVGLERAGAYITTILISMNTIEIMITAATSWNAGDSEVIALFKAVLKLV